MKPAATVQRLEAKGAQEAQRMPLRGSTAVRDDCTDIRSRRIGGHMTAGQLMGIGFIADGRGEVLTATRENLRDGASQIKVMAGGGAASAYDPLDVVQCTLDEMKAAVEAADV
jgi:hypothetical protein